MITPSAARRPDPPPRTIRLVPNLTQQVDTFFSGHASAPSNALYTFSIGANDLFAILDGIDGRSTPRKPLPPPLRWWRRRRASSRPRARRTWCCSTCRISASLRKSRLLVRAASAAATALSAYFDQQVLLDLAPVEAAGLTVFDLNTYALIDEAVQDPSAFGFSNVTDPCWTGGFTGSATGGSLCSTLPAVQDTLPFLGRRPSDRGGTTSRCGRGAQRPGPTRARALDLGDAARRLWRAWALPDIARGLARAA